MIRRRTAIKWLHWVSLFLILYFYLVEPDENRADPGGALSTHSGVGVVLGIAAGIWFAMYLLKGQADRPGPKLPGWAKVAHHRLHQALYIGVPVMVLSGALTGLLAAFLIQAFGVLPINFAGGSKTLNNLAEDVHELVFDALIIVTLAHTAFHLWRHYLLKDNALRIMAPRILRNYL